MEDYSNITRIELQQYIEPRQVLVTRIIGFAMLAGPLIFLLVIWFISSQKIGQTETASAAFPGEILINVFFGLILVVYSAAWYLPKIYLTRNNLQKLLAGLPQGGAINTPFEKVNRLLALDRQFMIIRGALLEGAALFGLVILFLHAVEQQPVTDLNRILLLLPVAVQLVFVIRNFGSTEAFVQRIEKNILSVLKHGI